MRLGGQALLSAGIVAALLGAVVVVSAGNASDAVVELRSDAGAGQPTKPPPGPLVADEPGSIGWIGEGNDPDTDDAAGRINRLAQYQDNGYSSTAVDNVRKHVTVWWHDTVDPDVQDVIDGVRSEGKVTVTVMPAEKSTAEINEIQQRLWAHPRVRELGIRISSMTSPPDNSGLNVSVEPLGELSEDAKRARIAEFIRAAEEITGVRILSVEESTVVPL